MAVSGAHAGTTLVLCCWRGAEGTCTPCGGSSSSMRTIPSGHTHARKGTIAPYTQDQQHTTCPHLRGRRASCASLRHILRAIHTTQHTTGLVTTAYKLRSWACAARAAQRRDQTPFMKHHHSWLQQKHVELDDTAPNCRDDTQSLTGTVGRGGVGRATVTACPRSSLASAVLTMLPTVAA